MGISKQFNEHQSARAGLDIAVIGVAGRFPGAGNTREFWNNLKNGVESIAFFSDRELLEEGVSSTELEMTNYIKAKGVLEDIEYFDAAFFGYSPREAEKMDPQIRILHECAWHALEDAGYDPYSYQGSIGLYVGAQNNFPWQARVFLSGSTNAADAFNSLNLVDKDHISTRIAYKLNLTGPTFSLVTQCSTSLVGLHQACQGLISRESDMALAGGISITLPQKAGYHYQEGMIYSSDGHLRAFAGSGSGTVFGNGVGIVVLKLLEDAIMDNDHILAVVKSSFVNNDGNRKVGYTAPSVEGQAEAIRTALDLAEVEPESIGYIETHGTATALGDAIEIDALNLAFNTDKKQFCRIGTVKTNIGHLENASGVAGLIKTVLALKHRLIPPSLHFEIPNREIDFENSPFMVNRELFEWKHDGYPLRAGISSFGIGGTNAHVVLEEFSGGMSGLAPLAEEHPSRKYQLILLSAKTQTALDQMSENLVNHFKANPTINLADAAYTLQVGRRGFKYRKALVCSSIPEAVAALTGKEPPDTRPSRSESTGKPNPVHLQTFFNTCDHRPVYFMFPGLGSQYVGMGRELYEQEPVFRAEMNRCFKILEPLMDFDLKEVLYPGDPGRGGNPYPPAPVNSPLERGAPEGRGVSKPAACKLHPSPGINQPQISQTVIFIFEYALAQLLMSWGIHPRAMIGYSFGEYAAACVSGVFTLEDVLKLIIYRGQLLEETPPGGMLSVPLPADEVSPWLPHDLAIAVDNGSSSIVAGLKTSMEAFAEQLKKKKYLGMWLDTSQAVHSPLMNPIIPRFTAKLSQISLNKPQIPYISNVTGQFLESDQAPDPAYWARHLGGTVRFADGINQLIKEPEAIFIEIGSGRDLTTMVQRYFHQDSQQKVVNLVRHPKKNVPDTAYLLNKLGSLWLYGIDIHWPSFYNEEVRRRVSLPPYPFARERYWIDDNPLQEDRNFKTNKSSPVKEANIANWFYLFQWERSRLMPVPAGKIRGKHEQEKSYWLIFINDLDICRRLLEQLRREDRELILVEPGPGFSQKSMGSFTIDPSRPAHYHTLMQKLQQSNSVPLYIVHLWGLGNHHHREMDRAAVDEAQVHGLYSLLYLVQAIIKCGSRSAFTVNLVFNQVHEVIGDETLFPAKATVVALAKTVQQEVANIRCRCIDIVLPDPGHHNPGNHQVEKPVRQLVEELSQESPDTVIAYRGSYRWVEAYRPIRLEEINGRHPCLKEKGVYLITGGLGNIGFILAKFLAGTYHARLILTSRTGLPPRDQWKNDAGNHQDKTGTFEKIKKVLELEKLGSEVLVFGADAADSSKMQELVTRVEEQWGSINGIVHAAGIVGGDTFKPVEILGKEEFQRQFHPKVYGTLVLEKLFRDRHLDFCLLISSPASILGGLGFAPYGSANIFVDAFVYWVNRSNRSPWLTVNWADWEVAEVKNPNDLMRGYVGEMLMTPAEGVETFRRILTCTPVNQVVVSAGDFQHRLNQWVKLEALHQEKNTEKKKSTPSKPRPNLMEPYVAPRTPLEEILVQTWKNLFGFEKIGVHDNFFELGGDSLKSLQVSARMLEQGYKVSIKDIFDSQDIAELARLIECSDAPPAPEETSMTKNFLLTLAPDQLDRLQTRYTFEDLYPLTPMQEGMFFHALYDPSSHLYIEQKCFRLQGELDILYVKQGIQELCKRYEILRTAFVLNGFDRPLQVVLKDREVDFSYEDISQTGASEHKERMIKDFKEKERNRLFKLDQDVLLRVNVLRLENRVYEFIWTYHHILMDGWCIGRVAAEFFEIYNGLKKGKPVQLSEIKPYRAYIQWLENQDKEASKGYWKKYLENYTKPVGLTGRNPGEIMPGGNKMERFFFQLAAQKSQLLHKLCERNRITLTTAVHTVWGIILCKYHNKQDAVFGTVVSGRPPEIRDVETMIGLFINTVPVRIQLTGETSFKELVSRVQREALAGQPYHHCPLADIQSQSPVKQQLFDNFITFDQIVFNEAQIMENKKDKENGSLKILNQESFGHSNYDFNLIVNVREQLDMEIKYNAGVIAAGFVERMASYIEEVIDIIIADDTVKIEDIKLSHGLSMAAGNVLHGDHGDFRL